MKLHSDLGQTTVHGRVARYAHTSPATVAIVSGDEQLTYAELDARAGRVAGDLWRAGVRPGDPVAVLLDRSAELVVALLAVLKVGAAYLALDHHDPRERLVTLVADAGVTVALTGPELAGQLPAGVSRLLMTGGTGRDGTGHGAGWPEPPGHRECVAYIAYTSGSTGQPKGVGVPHHAICRLVLGQNFVSIGPDDVFLHYAPAAFDASTWEIWGPLLNGGKLIIAPPGDLGARELTELVRRAGVTVLWLTAGLFHHVVDVGLPELPALRYLIAGGDVLSVPHVNQALAALPHGIVINGYGPTENTTFTCCYPVAEPLSGPDVPIGRPINGTDVYLLDDGLQPVPAGETGLLYASGSGVAHGYRNSPALTAERFVPDPFAGVAGARMYNSGDRARLLPGGILQFAGRQDSQVKIRGFRIEPAEIEAALRGYPGVRNAAVVAQDGGPAGLRLVAFYDSDLAIPTPQLRHHLAGLPAYLRPAVYSWLSPLPLTANGKVDRVALMNRKNRDRPGLGTAYRPPATPEEEWLVSVWQELMRINGIGVDDNFFELGGHSLLAVLINNEIVSEFDVIVTARAFYENPTIAQLAACLTRLRDAGTRS